MPPHTGEPSRRRKHDSHCLIRRATPEDPGKDALRTPSRDCSWVVAPVGGWSFRAPRVEAGYPAAAGPHRNAPIPHREAERLRRTAGLTETVLGNLRLKVRSSRYCESSAN